MFVSVGVPQLIRLRTTANERGYCSQRRGDFQAACVRTCRGGTLQADDKGRRPRWFPCRFFFLFCRHGIFPPKQRELSISAPMMASRHNVHTPHGLIKESGHADKSLSRRSFILRACFSFVEACRREVRESRASADTTPAESLFLAFRLRTAT